MKKHITQMEIKRIKHGKGEGSFIDAAGMQKEAEVPFSMPGDIVNAEVHRKKRGVFPARFLELIQPSPERITPECPHFGICGGCSYQHIPYSMQLAQKQAEIEALFKDFIPVQPIKGCKEPYRYRNKMEFTFSQNREKERFLGLFMSGRRGHVFNVTDCKLVSSWFNQALKAVFDWWGKTDLQAYYPPRDSGTLRTLTLRESATTKKRMAMLTVSGNPEFALHQPELHAFKELFDEEVSVYLRIHQAIKGKPTQFYEMHLKGPEAILETLTLSIDSDQPASSVNFDISPTAFFQPNTLQAEVLYQEALKSCGLSKEDVVYDLYCGTGTLGLLAARFVKRVVGIELSAESSLDARENAKKNGIDNVEIITGALGEQLKLHRDLPLPTVILLDPPRSGLDPSSLQEVLAFDCPRIIYISCNPATQVRDVQMFAEAGYVLEKIQPIDQFPNTPHIENIAVLKKIGQPNK